MHFLVICVSILQAQYSFRFHKMNTVYGQSDFLTLAGRIEFHSINGSRCGAKTYTLHIYAVMKNINSPSSKVIDTLSKTLNH